MLKNNGFHNRHSPIYRLIAALSLDFTSGRLDPRITFSRTTNATLTNSAGLVAYAPHNLLTFSEQFDNAAWVKSNATVAANTTAAPDGSLTADTMTATAANGTLRNDPARLGEITNSIYVKRKTGTGGVQILDASGTYRTITVTSEWTRVSFTATATSVSLYGIRLSVSGDEIFIWGAQSENSSTATTYNPTTVKNLLGFTENFDNAAWTKSNASISATKVDDIYGQPFAQKLVEDTATGLHGVTSSVITLAGTSGTLSVYAKAGERNWVRLGHSTVSGSDTWFNLSTGTVGTVGAATTATSIDPMGNGWYRCSITVSIATSGTYNVRAATANGVFNYTGDGTSGIYIFGAQLADSASVDPYVYQPVAAPTSVAYYGPRFDYDPVTLAPKGLLIEEQRSNLVLNSATLATQNVTVAAVAHTLSFYGTGTVTLSGVSTAGPLVGTGSYPNRVTLTFTPTAGTLTLTVTGSVTMAQLEAGAFATSYIPTVASQVTRAADSASMIGNNFARWYNQTEGTFMVQGDTAKPTSLVASAQFMTVSDGTVNNNHRIRYITAGIDAVTVVGGAIQVDTNEVGYAANVSAKVAYAYQVNDYGFTVNGGTVQTITSATVPVVNSLQLGGFVANATPLNGHLQRFAYYNRRLSNTEEQGITS